MKNNPNTLKDDIPSGGVTSFSTISGSIGNYGMWAAAGMYAVGLGYNQFISKTGHKLDKLAIAGLVATGVGAAFGAVHGIKEAREIQHYRNAIATKIDGLEQNAQADRSKIDELTRALEAKEQARAV